MSDSTTKNITRAEFASASNKIRIGGDTNKEFLTSVKRQNNAKHIGESHSQPVHATDSSPLLISTPPVITKTLINLYPYLLIADKFLSVITWTCNDIWPSVLMVIVYIITVLYLESLVTYFGNIILALVFFGYAQLDRQIGRTIFSNAALEDILNVMDSVALKLDILLSPLTTVNRRHVEKLLITMFLFSPVYILFTWLFLPVRQMVLIGGLLMFTFHSPWARVSRRLLWKFRFVRLFVFHATGIDLGGLYRDEDEAKRSSVSLKTQRFFDAVSRKVSQMMAAAALANGERPYDPDNENQTDVDTNKTSSAFQQSKVVVSNGDSKGNSQGYEYEHKPSLDLDKPLRFTYVLYENQRRWLGLGWRPSMLNYERTAWTDEFLNEAPSPENFELPRGDSGMEWRWVDPMWRVDLTNDGTIDLKGDASTGTSTTTTTTPGEDEGYIYFDNQWKKPSTEETFGKYTRRRRWVRTAELIRVPSKDSGEGYSKNMRDISIVTATRGGVAPVEDIELIKDYHDDNNNNNTESSVSVTGISTDNGDQISRRKRVSSGIVGSYATSSDESPDLGKLTTALVE